MGSGGAAVAGLRQGVERPLSDGFTSRSAGVVAAVAAAGPGPWGSEPAGEGRRARLARAGGHVAPHAAPARRAANRDHRDVPAAATAARNQATAALPARAPRE